MTPGSTSSLYGAASVVEASSTGQLPGSSGNFSTFSAFDPLMENPPNKMCPSVEDLPTSSASAAVAAEAATFAAASSLVGGHDPSAFGVKFNTTSDCFPAEMAEILGSSPSVSSLSNGLTGSAFGPPHGLSASSSDPYSDLSRSLHHAGSLHPLSNASLESRGSTEEEGDDMNSQRPENKVSGLSKAFRALNDFGSVYSFE